LIAACVLLLLLGCKTDYPGQEAESLPPDAPIPVEVVGILPTEEPIPLEAGGTIGSKTEARLSFKIGGVIDRAYAEEGQYVRRGATLARLKTTEIDAQRAQAEQQRDRLRRDLDRTQKLYEENAATLEQVEQLTTALEVAKSQLEIAEFNRRYATITAPVSGRIASKMAETGELIGPGTPVYLITGEGRGEHVLRINVADRDLLQLREGDRAEVTLDAFEGRVIPATVTQVATAADPRTGIFEVELTLDAPELALRPGFIGRARVYPSNTDPHYRIPLAAMVEGEGRTVSLCYPKQGKAAQHDVRFTQLLDDALVVPADQLAGITSIITRGSGYLTDGDSITLTPTESAKR
jgi:RND family efflux transporter MFP subunit